MVRSSRMPASAIVLQSLRGVIAIAAVIGLASTGCSSSDDKSPEPTPGESDAGVPAADGGKQNALPSPTLPAATGTCPEFVEGMAAFSPGGKARDAQIYIDPAAAATMHGPLVVYWYGTGGAPTQAVQGLGADGIARIKAAGGVVIAPKHINAGTFPWIGGDGSDQVLMDEFVACASAKVGIDARRIHSLGFSAGGLYTGQLSLARSNYLASVATYSGGATGEFADPSNKFPAMILFGGTKDMLVLNFHDTSLAYKQALTDAGHFAFLCDHGGGHSIPATATASVVQFFFDHPYRTTPEPYAAGLPGTFPAYCTL